MSQIKVQCGICGSVLEERRIVLDGDIIVIMVAPCEKCESNSYADGYRNGQSVGEHR